MSGGPTPQAYARYRAPSENGEHLAAPRRDRWPALVEENRALLDALERDFFGRALSSLRDEARAFALQEAHRYTSRCLPTPETPDPRRPLIATGHQPELYHPGVWLKNFACAALAREVGGTALNVVIDSDLCRTTSIRVPHTTDGEAGFQAVPYDAAAESVPHEERRLVDASLFDSFGARAGEAISGVVERPLVRDWWPAVAERCRESGSISSAIAEARHQLEASWGASLLQVPLSALAVGEAYQWFLAVLVRRHAELLPVYNGCLADYRRAHRLRNNAQPMPDLTLEDGWHELPLWCWTADDPTRRGVVARLAGDEIELSDRGRRLAMLPAGPEGDAAPLAAALADLARSGVKLRTRALVTTAFARLFLSDLFLHGIGGAKYDQVTDRFCEGLFGFAPPPHATLSGTLRLPSDFDLASDARVAEASMRLRELRFHPERHADLTDDHIKQLVAEKNRWVREPKTEVNAAQRHREIEAVNCHLHEAVKPLRLATEEALALARRNARNAAVLGSREYSFCLFPEATLRGFLLDF